MDGDLLMLVFYYGEEGEVFQVFHDEDELDCPKLPLSFEDKIKVPVPAESSLRAKFLALE